MELSTTKFIDAVEMGYLDIAFEGLSVNAIA